MEILMSPLSIRIAVLLIVMSFTRYAAAAPWTTHHDPMGFAVDHPAEWRVATEAQLGRVTIQGQRGERVIIWPMFLRNRQLDARAAAVMVRQLASKLDARMSWSAPRPTGGYVAISARSAERETAAVMSWANSQNGASIIFYNVGAPAGSYRPTVGTFAGILKSFRIEPPPAKQEAVAQGSPPGPVQYVRWTDPREGAFTASVPQGWKVIGGLYRLSPLDVRPAVTLLAPGGGMRIKVGDSDLGAFQEPINSPIGGMRSGANTFSDGSKAEIRPFVPGPQFARYYLERYLRQECGNQRVTSNRNRQDLAGSFLNDARAEGWPSNGQMTVGDISFTCSIQGVELEGYYVAATIRVPTTVSQRGMGGALWYVYRIYGYLARPERRQEAESISRQVLQSFQLNPEWRARQKQTAQVVVMQDNARSQAIRSRALAAIAEDQRQTSDLISRSYWDQQRRYDEISRKRENAILGTVDVVNPTTGEQYKVEYNSNYYWMNDPGYMTSTLTHDAPAVGWQEMIQLP